MIHSKVLNSTSAIHEGCWFLVLSLPTENCNYWLNVVIKIIKISIKIPKILLWLSHMVSFGVQTVLMGSDWDILVVELVVFDPKISLDVNLIHLNVFWLIYTQIKIWQRTFVTCCLPISIHKHCSSRDVLVSLRPWIVNKLPFIDLGEFLSFGYELLRIVV